MNDTLLEALLSFQNDPYGFVMWAFPWGEKDSDLEDKFGPEPWQKQLLEEMRDDLLAGKNIIREGTTSGHGIGKSACVSWIILWALSTMPNTRGVVTANTEKQLRTKTWSELAIWFGRFIAKDLFDFDATSVKVKTPESDEKASWRIDMIPWSERNTEAFAGLHNQGRRILLIMDEGSGIPDQIWEVAEGALTDMDTQIIWCVFGNPTRNKGRFHDCFEGRFARRWKTRRVDSREVSFTNKEQIASWIEDYGEDSDFVRVRVRGIFPRVDSESFISYVLATDAIEREVNVHPAEPIILGVDVGRFGDDPSVIVPRRGRDAVSIPWEVMHGLDTMQVAARVAAAYLRCRATVVMVDSGGVGGGVADRLRMMQIPVMDVDFGSKATNEDGVKCANKRAEIWKRMRDWLTGGAVPAQVQGSDITLVDDLTAPRYGMNTRDEILLEGKADMRRRGVKSPNLADALACTFAFPVYVPEDGPVDKQFIADDYNPYERERVLA